ncbi:hypothetical protein X962_5761 [Burkholderia pseudomallei MSHR7343]|nr:hypothetical protein X962_5761 [Burkholderia pseudomallei MSHR7343]
MGFVSSLSPAFAGLFVIVRLVETGELLDLGFLVRHVLAGDGIELHDLHLFRHVALVLRGRIEVTRASGGLELDFVACAFRHVRAPWT